MSWLGGVAASFVTGILEWLGKWLGVLFEFIYKKIEVARRRKQIDEEAKASVEPLKNAKTSKEIDAAAKEALDGF